MQIPHATFNDGNGVVPPFTSPGIVSGVFEWQTDCSHMTKMLVVIPHLMFLHF